MKNILKNVPYTPSVDTDNGFIITGHDNLDVLKTLPDNCVDQIYIDPPYLTNKTWEKNGWSFEDSFPSMWDYLFFLGERLVEAKRVMRTSLFKWEDGKLYRDGKEETYQPIIDKIVEDWVDKKSKRKQIEKGVEIGASIFVHVDYRTNNEIKTYLLDPLFGEGKTTLEWEEVQALMKIKIGKKCHTPVSVPAVDIPSGPSICMDFFGGSHSYAAQAYLTGRRFISIEKNKSEQLFLDAIEGKEFGCERED